MAAIVVACAGLIATEVWVRQSAVESAARLQQQFETLSRRIHHDVDARFGRALAPLRGVRSYFMASGAVERAEFQTYVKTRDLDSEYPGIRGLGLIERVAPERLSRFEAAQRRDGAPAFEVITSVKASQHYVIKFIEPLYRNMAAVGFDIASEPRRRQAAEAAMLTGQPTLTAPITLLQDASSGTGFLYLLPWYAGDAVVPDSLVQRQKLLRGWVFAPLVLSELMAGSQFDLGGQLRFELFFHAPDASQQWLFSSDGRQATASSARYRMETELALGGQSLHLRTFSTPEFELGIDPQSSMEKRALGFTVSVLLAALAWLMMGARLRAMALAQEMTRDLSRLATVARHTSNAVIFTDLQERIVWVNESFTRISGYSFEEALGQTPGRLLQSERTDLQARRAMRQSIDQRTSCRQVILNTHKNGTDYWLDLDIQPLRNEQGEVTGFVALESDVSNVIESQHALERSQAIFRGSIDAVNEAYVLFDPQDRLVFCNQKYRDLYALSADLIVPGASFESIVRGGAERGQYRDAIGRVDAWVQERMTAHLDGNVTLEQRLDDGRWLRIVERKMADGHIVGFRVDITELKRATEAAMATSAALSTQQERLQSILQGTNVGTWLWNVQTGECEFNDRWAQMLGYALEELQPTTIAAWQKLLTPHDLERCSFLLEEHFAGHSDFYAVEVPMLHKDGHHVWVLARGKVSTWTPDGKPLRMAGTHTDISERKSAELKLAETTSTLQNVLASAVDVGVLVIDAQRVIRIFNKGAERLLGYGAEEMVGRVSEGQFFEPRQLRHLRESLGLRLGREPTVDDVFWDIVNTRGQAEWTMMRKDGSCFTASCVFSPMLDSAGALDGFVTMMYDITRQKETEASLREAMHLAEQSNVAKSQFLANMSHEIRTPMNAILGMLQLLQATVLTARQRDYTEKTRGAAKALLGLLNDILDFSKVEAGKMHLEAQPFAVSELLEGLSVILSSNLKNKPVDLVFDLDPAIPQRLVGDALRLKQILINLAGNAVKFTESGQVTIVLRQIAQEAESVQLEVAVEDTGIGIAPENQGRIFQAFTQAEASTTRRFGGTGLGLVISTRLIRLMGGELSLRSTVGKGSTFSFTVNLPIAPVVPSLAHDMESAPPLCVLLVDDNVRALETLARTLRSMDWEVTTSASGEDAVGRVRARQEAGHAPFDAVLADKDMPVMDGWETLRAVVRVYGNTAHPKRILMSTQNREGLARHSEREQDWLDGFLVKPLTASMVAQAVLRGCAALDEEVSHGDLPAAQMRLAGMRILVVEDNLINQQVARELLEGQGATVTVAADGQQGLDALAVAQPLFDVVLMDLQMPVMDGLTAARLLRRNPVWRDLPVVAMTANAMVSDREACLEAGMNDHVGKPFDLQMLVGLLVELTGWTSQPQASGSAVAPSAGQAEPQSVWPKEIDVEAALKRMGGNRDLLARAIRAYVQESEGWIERVQNQQIAGEWSDLVRDLHALKGLSATIGVETLRVAAQQAEHCLKAHLEQPAGSPPAGLDTCIQAIHALLEPMRPALCSVADQLDGGIQPRQLKAAGRLATPVVLTPAQVTVLRSLHALLRQSDMQAMEAHGLLEPALRRALGSRLDTLDAAMAELDFAQAAVECAALIDSA